MTVKNAVAPDNSGFYKMLLQGLTKGCSEALELDPYFLKEIHWLHQEITTAEESKQAPGCGRRYIPTLDSTSPQALKQKLQLMLI